MSRARSRLSLLLSMILLLSLAVPNGIAASSVQEVGDIEWSWVNPAPTPEGLWAIDFVGSTGWAVGDAGTVAKTVDDGASWSATSVAGAPKLMDVAFADTSNGWAVGYNYVTYSSDGGATWTQQTLPTPVALYAVDTADSSSAIAVGNQAAFKTSDGGQTWESSLTTSTVINDIEHISGNEFWAVGASGRLLVTSDGGANWSSSAIATSTAQLAAIARNPSDPSDVWVIGYSYSPAKTFFLHTTNGGVTWSETVSSMYLVPNDIVVANGTTVYASAQYGCIMTTDSGASWDRFYPVQTARAIEIGSSGQMVLAGDYGMLVRTADGQTFDEGDAFTRESLFAADFVTPDMGWVVGNSGTIACTVDGGSTWEVQDSGILSYLEDVDFLDASTGFAVGGSYLIYTSDGGASWEATTPHSGTYTSVSFPSANEGWVVGYHGFAMHTANGGASWSKVDVGTSAYLMDVEFVNEDSGWMVGRDGTILHTSDGGANWASQTSGLTQHLEAVDFVDANTGWAVGGSGGVVKTDDGGATWTAVSGFSGIWSKDVVVQTANDIWISDNRSVRRSRDGGATWNTEFLLSNSVSSQTGLAMPDDSRIWFVGPGGWVCRGDIEVPAPVHVPADPERISSSNRFNTAVAIAAESFPGWSGIQHVVIASGDDRAAADPLAAAGLCWAYDAPLLLVPGSNTPHDARAAIKAIVDVNGPVMVHVVGGPVSVPEARLDEIKQYVGAGNVQFDRVLSTGSRYDLAAAIAREMDEVRGAEMGNVALVANGADSTKFFDALALSPIAARIGAPILLVSYDTIPTATSKALADLGLSERYVGGGQNTVSNAVKNALSAERWSSDTRYTTATTIASKAIGKGWLSPGTLGIAAKLPDALTGGSAVGRAGGPLVLTKSDSLVSTTGSFLSAHKESVDACWVFGGKDSVSDPVLTAIGNALK